MTRTRVRSCARAIAVFVALVASGQAGAQSPESNALHLGVASCAGSNCHGATDATERSRTAPFELNQFVTWSTRDKHRNAYLVLLQPRAEKMAHALGLPNAENSKICLDCHADNVPQDRRGRQFQLSDGVGCEACHGGASPWLGIHISGLGHQANLAAGLYPTEKPMARAEKCLSCHFGDETKIVNHRLIGAGHPRLGFELDTYTAIEPAHFVVDKSYIERKGRITDVQVWAAGQAIALAKRMDALLDPKQAHMGIFPELVLFDCQSCHHVYDSLNAPRPTTSGLGPGTVKLNDANEVMLRVAAARIAPGVARSLNEHMLALHKATTENWSLVAQEASAVRQAASQLAPALADHDFTGDDLRAMTNAVLALGLSNSDSEASHAEQTAMALESLVSAMRATGEVSDDQANSVKTSMSGVYAAFPSDAVFRPDAFVTALRNVQRTLSR